MLIFFSIFIFVNILLLPFNLNLNLFSKNLITNSILHPLKSPETQYLKRKPLKLIIWKRCSHNCSLLCHHHLIRNPVAPQVSQFYDNNQARHANGIYLPNVPFCHYGHATIMSFPNVLLIGSGIQFE